ncbi:PREDICTED: NAC domain-containing protein 17-like isoform X3 [Ipomoea nil]|uniref:NAC domain-containing protein 17-like isoform X2 n=1 Tax=Ipomoea nil TaxID=35883 RepID=UPI000901B9AC|nr:PREDICTED: NAC domain-containing protein 17-like isoform X2 [Ipomoea nil]XP_019194784.1 PREDICTED: NAC domain-containing protein 17-like isoform X3 [Ipomoea nil]
MVMAKEGFPDQRLPPGFRFHPTDEELLLYFLKRRICRRQILTDVIGETDVYKWDPDDLPELSKLKTGDRQWFFFSPMDRKYPNGRRTNRATKHGYWKTTGKDRTITCNSRDVGVKKTLVFYKGRAPTGERTDWVMHEYTLGEMELSRCQSAQDYYALYKVFKKSGPGPKNGEQYGAPFNEEDWADDECFGTNLPVEQEKSRKNVNDVGLINDPKPNDVLPDLPPLIDGLEEFLKYIADEPSLTELVPVDNSYVDKLVGNEDTANALLDHSAGETYLPVQTATLFSLPPLHNEQANFDPIHSWTLQPQLHEATEVTSAPVVEEDFLEGFLEMNDLDGSELSVNYNLDKPVENYGSQQVVDFDGLNEFELYQDAAMFLHDMGAIGVGQGAGQATNHVANSIINPSEVSQMINQQSYLNEGNEFNHQLWSHDLRWCSTVNLTEASQSANLPLTSGMVYGNHFEDHPVGANLNQNNIQDDATNSSFSSALWVFIESIPATPASAAESALVNKAFERMSSFIRRIRLNARNVKVASGNTSATSRRSGKSKNGLFCFSLIGVLCAILWMFVHRSLIVVGRKSCHYFGIFMKSRESNIVYYK